MGPSDTVVLASSLIPGNENSVFRVINGLARLGAHIVHKGNALVHVSGHAAAGELRYVYNIVKPRYVMPVHGEWRHMRANAEIAASVGIDRDARAACRGRHHHRPRRWQGGHLGYLPVGFVYVDGIGVGDVTEASLKDRRVLGEEGFISIFVAVDIVEAKVVAGPEIHVRGLRCRRRADRAAARAGVAGHRGGPGRRARRHVTSSSSGSGGPSASG